VIIKIPGGELRDQHPYCMSFRGGVVDHALMPESPDVEKNLDSMKFAMARHCWFHPSTLIATVHGQIILSLLVGPHGSTLKDDPPMKQIASWGFDGSKTINVGNRGVETVDEYGAFKSQIPLGYEVFKFEAYAQSLGAKINLMINGFMYRVVR